MTMIDGAEMKRRRDELKLSQKELGERIGTSQNVISRAETGIKDLSITQIATIAAIFGCGVDDLLICREALKNGKRRKRRMV